MRDDQQPPKPSGIKFDLTINIPMMTGLVITLMTGSMWLARVDAKADQALNAANDVKQVQAAQTASTAREISAIRTELRDDVKDVSQKVDQIIWRLGDSPRNLSDWTKK
ncbi:hypothetical protein [Bordetella petrii]|uniref:hypothetical protein n=1 Tax=Bordetella petrii TaxID=94624 RepID=UPI00048F4498|nr:hypothetical protein [Bordetella petrii]